MRQKSMAKTQGLYPGNRNEHVTAKGAESWWIRSSEPLCLPAFRSPRNRPYVYNGGDFSSEDMGPLNPIDRGGSPTEPKCLFTSHSGDRIIPLQSKRSDNFDEAVNRYASHREMIIDRQEGLYRSRFQTLCGI